MTPDPPSHAGDYAPGRRARETRAVGAPRASKRRMSPGRKLWYALLVALARGLLWLIWRSCRVRVHGGEHLDALRQAGSPAVIVYWHQMQIFCGWLLKRQSAQGMPIAVLTSPSVSGEVPAALMRRWGVRPVRGSSTRSAAEALREMYTVVATDRQSLVITADGPKGPRHEFKPGAVLLARMSRAPIVPMAFAASRCTRWNSWDEFILPWPFSRVAVVVGEPLQAPTGSALSEVTGTCSELAARLDALSRQAAQMLR